MFPFRREDSAPRTRRGGRLEITSTGVIYILMMLFLCLAAINTGSNLLYGVFGLMIGVLLLTGVLSRGMLRGLHVHRVLPDHAIAGVPVTFVYEFQNNKRFWPSFAVSVVEQDEGEAFVREPLGYLLHAAPKERVSVSTIVVPRRRGVHELDHFRLYTGFPFGFVRRSVGDRQPDRLLIYPPIGHVDPAVMKLCRPADTHGSQMRPRQGGQDEFYGVKEFRPGESPRHIYWKRSARTANTGTLVTREMTHVAPPRLLVLVDSWLVDRDPASVADVERSIAMAATLIDSALGADLSVGLVAWSGDWKTIEPSTGKRQRGDLLSFLARLSTNVVADTAALLAQAQRHTRSGATAVLFTPRAIAAGRDSRNRERLVVIPADAEQSRTWFKFDPAVEFGPQAEQQDA